MMSSNSKPLFLAKINQIEKFNKFKFKQSVDAILSSVWHISFIGIEDNASYKRDNNILWLIISLPMMELAVTIECDRFKTGHCTPRYIIIAIDVQLSTES